MIQKTDLLVKKTKKDLENIIIKLKKSFTLQCLYTFLKQVSLKQETHFSPDRFRIFPLDQILIFKSSDPVRTSSGQVVIMILFLPKTPVKVALVKYNI